MIRTELPLPRAMRALMELARSQATGFAESVSFALVWLATARMVLTGSVPSVQNLTDLTSLEAWSALEQQGLPLASVHRWLEKDNKVGGVQVRAQAVSVVLELEKEVGSQHTWDVLPAFTGACFSSRSDTFEGVVAAEVVELMLDFLGEPAGTLWIPFDQSGAIAMRALRRGWDVNTASMHSIDSSLLPLLLAIETGRTTSSRVQSHVERDSLGRPLTQATHILATPPFGIPVRYTRMAQWDSSGGENSDMYARSESWAVHELINRASKKAVFLVPPGVLFTRGQEQRLREYLLHRGGEYNELEAVVALPQGVLCNTSMGSAVLVMSPGRGNDAVRMVDLGLSRRSMANVDELVQAHRNVALGFAADEERARLVTRDEIMATEVSFAPARYLHKLIEVGPNAVALEDLFEVIRPPVVARDDNSIEFSELGIPDLGGWTAIAGPLEKKVRIRGRRDLPTLEEGDVVVSVKGTVGKTGLVSALVGGTAVLSQSCIALRARSSAKERKVRPEYLLMYLRSEAGQAQLSSLQSGATIQHVSPGTLMSSFLVPLPEEQEQQTVVDDYAELCGLESKIASIGQHMSAITAKRWKA